MARNNLKKSNKVGEIILDIKNYYLTKLGLWYLQRDRKRDQWNWVEKLEMNPHKYAQLKLLTMKPKWYNGGGIAFQ